MTDQTLSLEEIGKALEGVFAPFIQTALSPLPTPESIQGGDAKARRAAFVHASRAVVGAKLLRWSAIAQLRRRLSPTDFISQLSEHRVHVDDARDMDRALDVAVRAAHGQGDCEGRLVRLCQYEPNEIARLFLVSDDDIVTLAAGGRVRGLSLDDVAEEVRHG